MRWEVGWEARKVNGYYSEVIRTKSATKFISRWQYTFFQFLHISYITQDVFHWDNIFNIYLKKKIITTLFTNAYSNLSIKYNRFWSSTLKLFLSFCLWKQASTRLRQQKSHFLKHKTFAMMCLIVILCTSQNQGVEQ